MMVLAVLVAIKSAGLALAGGSRLLAHVHAGLAIYAVSHVFATRRAPLKALIAVAVAATANEALAATMAGHWSTEQRLPPALMTIAWPVALFVVSHVRRWRWVAAQLRHGGPAASTASGRIVAPMLAVIPGGRVALTGQRLGGGRRPRLRVFPGSAGHRLPG